MDEGVVERGKDAGNAKDELALGTLSVRARAGREDCWGVTDLADLGSKLDVLLRTALDLLLGRHVGCV